MRKGVILGAASVVAITVAIVGLSRRGEDNILPPTMQPDGEAVDKGIIVQTRTIDYESIIKKAFAENASFLTLTWKRDVIRDQYLEQSINYTPFPASRARVRVKYHAEFPIGYDLRPGKFDVTGGADALTVAVGRPQLVARPSIKLQSYQILERVDSHTVNSHSTKRAAATWARRTVGMRTMQTAWTNRSWRRPRNGRVLRHNKAGIN